MAQVKGLVGLRPVGDSIASITCPPYDVIKEGSPLERVLKQSENSLYHITLGSEPVKALARLQAKGLLQEDETPCFYVYEQVYGKEMRRGVFTATEVTDYRFGNIIRHEKTFDDKVKGRLALREKTGYTFEPVFLLTEAPLRAVLMKWRAARPRSMNLPPILENTPNYTGSKTGFSGWKKKAKKDSGLRS